MADIICITQGSNIKQSLGERLNMADIILQFKRKRKNQSSATANVDVKATSEDIENRGKSPNITSFARIRKAYINVICNFYHKVHKVHKECTKNTKNAQRTQRKLCDLCEKLCELSGLKKVAHGVILGRVDILYFSPYLSFHEKIIKRRSMAEVIGFSESSYLRGWSWKSAQVHSDTGAAPRYYAG